MKYKWIIIIIFSTLFSITDYVYTGTRNAALAGAVTSLKNVKSFHQNPALLNDINSNFINIESNNQYGLKYLKNQSVIATFESLKFGRIGFYFNKSDVKYFKKLSSDHQISLSKAFTFQRDRNSFLEFGISLNHYNIEFGKSAGVHGDGSLFSVEENSFNQFGVDVGFLASLRDKYRFGAFYKNINSPEIGKGVSSSYLPRRISISSTYTPVDDFAITFELENELGKTLQVQSGVKYNVISGLELLLGIQSNPNRFGFGLFYNMKSLDIGWSILSHQILPYTQSFSIGYNF